MITVNTIASRDRNNVLRRALAAALTVVLAFNLSGTPIDSLYQVYKGAQSSSKHIVAQHIMEKVHQAGYTDTVMKITKSMHEQEMEARVHYCMAEHYYDIEEYEKSLQEGRLAMPLMNRVKEPRFKSDLLGIIANAYFRVGNYDETLKTLLELYQYDLKLKDFEQVSSDLNMFGALFLAINQPEPGISYIESAIAIERKLDRPDRLASRLGIASELYLANNDPNKAMEAIEEALEIDNSLGNKEKTAIRLVQKAAVLLRQSRLDESESILNDALPTLQQHNNLYSLAAGYNLLGSIAGKKGHTQEAVTHFKNALDLSVKCGAPKIERTAERGLWETLREENPAVALLHLERYATLTDSLHIEISATTQARAMDVIQRNQGDTFGGNGGSNKLLKGGIIMTILALLMIAGLIYTWLKTRKTMKMQHKVHQMQTRLFTNITNELQVPLTVIMNSGQQLAQSGKTNAEESRQLGTMIVNHGRKMLGLVNQMLDIENVRSSIRQPELKHGDIVLFTRLLVDNYTEQANAHKIWLEFVSPMNSMMVEFAPEYIRKIVHMLVANALKFTVPEKGMISVQLTAPVANMLRIAVVDNGKGIPPHELDHIFEPFNQGENGDDDVATGLDLSLVNQLVKAMNGTIAVDSVPGNGTTFTIDFPVKPQDNTSFADLPMEEQHIGGDIVQPSSDNVKQRPSVFIVENNDEVGFFIASHLRDNYNLRFAKDGQEAFQNAQDLVPDLIITNMMMPVMDGWQLIRKLRENASLNHIPIIAMTYNTSEAERMACIEVGADAVLVKPFNSGELKLLVRHFIKQRSALREQFARIEASNSDETPTTVMSKEDKEFINKLIDVIHAQMAKDDIDMEHIAAALSLSRKQLRTRVMAITGLTPVAFALQVRLNYAKRMIMSEDSSLTVIANKCGFQNLSHFSKAFKQQFKVSPLQFRKSMDDIGHMPP